MTGTWLGYFTLLAEAHCICYSSDTMTWWVLTDLDPADFFPFWASPSGGQWNRLIWQRHTDPLTGWVTNLAPGKCYVGPVGPPPQTPDFSHVV